MLDDAADQLGARGDGRDDEEAAHVRAEPRQAGGEGRCPGRRHRGPWSSRRRAGRPRRGRRRRPARCAAGPRWAGRCGRRPPVPGRGRDRVPPGRARHRARPPPARRGCAPPTPRGRCRPRRTARAPRAAAPPAAPTGPGRGARAVSHRAGPRRSRRGAPGRPGASARAAAPSRPRRPAAPRSSCGRRRRSGRTRRPVSTTPRAPSAGPAAAPRRRRLPPADRVLDGDRHDVVAERHPVPHQADRGERPGFGAGGSRPHAHQGAPRAAGVGRRRDDDPLAGQVVGPEQVRPGRRTGHEGSDPCIRRQTAAGRPGVRRDPHRVAGPRRCGGGLGCRSRRDPLHDPGPDRRGGQRGAGADDDRAPAHLPVALADQCHGVGRVGVVGEQQVEGVLEVTVEGPLRRLPAGRGPRRGVRLEEATTNGPVGVDHGG